MLSLILPTYNEAQNVMSLLGHLDGVLRDTPHEIIVVDDDSPDGTANVVAEFARLHRRVKVLPRRGKKGLSSAVVDGFDAAHGTVLAVMDADLQHDALLLLRLLAAIEQGTDLSIGSRYMEGGSIGDWVVDRRIISSTGTFFARRLARVPVTDPLGGFFAIRADLYRSIRPRLRPTGFKILLEILAHVPSSTRVLEVPLIFRMRLHGQSKLSLGVHVTFAYQVLRLALSRALEKITAYGSRLFLCCLLLGSFFIVPRLWSIGLLYMHASLRHEVQASLQMVADRQGWLLSDIELTAVTPASVSILHRVHLRSSTPPRSCSIDLHTSLLSCVD